ncbi:MAG: hypothetical protein IT374_27635 [Polyangiaceae bacterium]|nr:hypothetical protein [Polyangiaceae bacterium]
MTTLPPAAVTSLSPRRLEVLQLLARGLRNQEIGRLLGLTTGTVRSHVEAVLAHLAVANRTEAAAEYFAWEARPAQVTAVLSRPAIAVLPLMPLSAGARLARIATALTEELAALFARSCWFPVIATTSSAHGRALGATAGEVGRALGARFLVDGTIQATGDVWRLLLHVDDVERGCRIWSDTHELRPRRLLSDQAALCASVVAAAYPMMVARSRLARVDAAEREPAAWELAHEGLELRAARDRASNALALERLDAALRRDPALALAQFGVGLVCYDAVLNQWGDRQSLLDRLLIAGTRCAELAPDAAEGHALLGRYEQCRGAWDRAIAPLEAAIGRNPSFALAHASLAQSLESVGRGDEAVARMRAAVRLGPRSFVAGLATLHFMRREYAEAVELAERAIVTNPGYPFARALAAASAWWCGDVARAGAHAEELERQHPDFHPDAFAATFGEQTDAVAQLRRGLDELRAARGRKICRSTD